MRLRNIKGAKEIVEACPYTVEQPQKASRKSLFGNDAPMYVEAGMGKGRFLIDMALKYPCRNFVGIERYESVMIRAVQKLEELDARLTSPGNIRLICMDAGQMEDTFAAGEISGIYLNFSDPWPKRAHTSRRLTSPGFLNVYKKVLVKDGFIEFKTDNRELFEYSLKSAGEAGWNIKYCTRDLYSDSAALTGNVMTEYEAKFHARGNPICKMIITNA